jgi:hypothetical protein|nr:MAG TPA: outer membrane protein assembly factor [Caudoviricetes sp.]
MKKIILILTALLGFPLLSGASPVPKEIYSQFKGVKIADLQRDIDLTDGVLWLRMNFDEPIPEVLGKSIVFNETCLNMHLNPKIWKKYPVKQIKVTTLVEWRAYIFNGGQKECNEIYMKDGVEKRYKTAPYFELWERK